MTSEAPSPGTAATHVELRAVDIGYGTNVVQRGLEFAVRRGEVFVIMGDSGCGKSTLLRSMVGLNEPLRGDVVYSGEPYWASDEAGRERLRRRFGVLYQGAALWSEMTLEENVALPLLQHTPLSPAEARALARVKLALVGLAGCEQHLPAQVSGGMRKRAGLARAMALDPEILYFDEPSAGLDPLSSRRLDDLVLELRDSLGTTIVLVTHELPSIFELGDHAVFLDSEKKTMTAQGTPQELSDCDDPKVRAFMRRERL